MDIPTSLMVLAMLVMLYFLLDYRRKNYLLVARIAEERERRVQLLLIVDFELAKSTPGRKRRALAVDAHSGMYLAE